MFNSINIFHELNKVRKKNRKEEDVLLDEVKNILSADLLKEKKILKHLQYYNESFELISEREVNPEQVFTIDEIKTVCVKYRLRFLDSQLYKNDFPYEAILKIKDANQLYRKDLKWFKVLAPANSFKNNTRKEACTVFAKTDNGKYYLIHTWGKKMHWSKKLTLFPLRTFETLFFSVALLTLIIDISLPVEWITLDRKVSYWCGYRIASYFHLLIFFSAFTAYITFTFNKNFSKSNWNSPVK